MIEFLVDYTQQAGFSDEKIADIQLVAEEILVNIIHYAYEGKKGDMEIECAVDDDSRLLIRFVDQGEPFDPLALPPPDLTSDVDERPVGGLGVFFVRELADEVHYARSKGRNILSLTIGR